MSSNRKKDDPKSLKSPKTPRTPQIQSSVGKSKSRTKTELQTSVSRLDRSPISQGQINQALALDRQQRRGIHVKEKKGTVHVTPQSHGWLGLSPSSMRKASEFIRGGPASPQTPAANGGSKKKVDYSLINSILKSFGADCKCNDNNRKKKRKTNKRSNR